MDSLNIQKVAYYDTYQYKKANSCFTAAMDYIDSNDYGHRFGDDSEQLNCKNLQTGVMTRIIGTDQMLCTSTYYDYFQRPVQVRSTDIMVRCTFRTWRMISATTLQHPMTK